MRFIGPGSSLALILSFGWARQVMGQGACDHYLDEDCVDAYGDTKFNFKPIFSEPVTFGYGFRVYFRGESARGISSGPPGYTGDFNLLKAWLSYDNSSVSIDREANRSSHASVIFTNASGTVGGGNNGCDGLLGKECAANLIDILKWAVVHADSYPIKTFPTVGKFRQTPLTNLSCPIGIFDEMQSMTGTFADGLLSEYEYNWGTGIGYRRLPPDSGNSSYPWAEHGMWISAEEQMTWAAVGIATRFPATRPRNHEDVDLQLVCVRPTPVEGSEDRIDVNAIPSNRGGGGGGGGGGDSNGDEDDNDAVQGRPVAIFVMVFLAFVTVLIPVL